MGNLQRTELYFLQLCELGSTNPRALLLAQAFLLCRLIVEGRRMRGQTQNRKGMFQAHHFYQELTAEN